MKWWEIIGISLWVVLILGMSILGFLEVWFDYRPDWLDYCIGEEIECDQYDDQPVTLYHVMGGIVFPLVVVLGGLGFMLIGSRIIWDKMRPDE